MDMPSAAFSLLRRRCKVKGKGHFRYNSLTVCHIYTAVGALFLALVTRQGIGASKAFVMIRYNQFIDRFVYDVVNFGEAKLEAIK